MLAVVLLMAGGVATLRKTAAVVPGVLALTLVVVRPQHFVRLAPFGLAALIGIQALTPSGLGQLNSQLFGASSQNSTSTEGRTQDYDAVGPDIWSKPVLGRGWGSYDAEIYRFLDNQYLVLLLEVGFVGLAAFLAVLAAVAARGWLLMRSPRIAEHDFGLALIGATAVFFVASALFDVVSFPNPVYSYLLLVGLAVAATPASRPPRPATDAPA
jgi:O-antigen ligase